jgi:type VI secretion system secreted protein VgrG
MESELLLVARQADRSCTFEIEGLTDNFWVVRFSGSEGVSSLYEFHLDVVARHIEVGELVGRNALLKVVGVGEPRLVHGIILRAEYTGEMRPRAMYRITLVPELYTLLLRTNSRIFQQMSTPDILRKVLDGAGIGRRLESVRSPTRWAPICSSTWRISPGWSRRASTRRRCPTRMSSPPRRTRRCAARAAA